jgi:hypothetical protein
MTVPWGRRGLLAVLKQTGQELESGAECRDHTVFNLLGESAVLEVDLQRRAAEPLATANLSLDLLDEFRRMLSSPFPVDQA